MSNPTRAEIIRALYRFLDAEFGGRVAPYQCSFSASDRLNDLLGLLDDTLIHLGEESQRNV